ncbi:uncharacterized protein LOC134687841 [Mytilus trossulus]|uniref:uncharacterized protein LOC134687841 n=1 Tax=Mytilus trossulus TaxID=6551 RepID=UPI003006BC78
MPGHEHDEETHVKFVVRNSFRDRKPIGYVTIEQSVDEETFQSLEYVDSRHEYVVQRKSPRSVGCQVNTTYEILLSAPKCPLTPIPPPSPPPSPPPWSSQSTCDVGCQMTTNYVILLSRYIPTTPLPPTPSPPPPPPISNKEEHLEYCIDLRQPVEIIEPKPFLIERRVIDVFPKPKVKQTKYEDYIVTVGGGWNKMDDYMERHEPVKRFVYEREHMKNSDLPEKKKKYYGFKSIYKSPGFTRAHRIL